jgi:hypothetical protein
MKKILLILLVLFLISGCVSSKGWTRKDGRPVEPKEVEDRAKFCNYGWEWMLVGDLMITCGILSIVHYYGAKNCMDRFGYEKKEEAQ